MRSELQLVSVTALVVASACVVDVDRFGPRAAGSTGGAVGSVSSTTSQGGQGGEEGLGGAGGATPACPYADAVMGDEPIAYWRLDEEPPEGVALDEVGMVTGDYRGAQLGGPPLIRGCDGSHATAFSAPEHYIQLQVPDAYEHDFSFPAKASFTVEFWVRLPESGEVGEGIIVGRRGVNDDGWSIDAGPSQNIIFRRGANHVDSQPLDAGGAELLPHHVVATYDGMRMCLGVDSPMAATCLGTVNELDGDTDHPMSIGEDLGVSGFQGVVDEVAIYGGVLGTAEIEDHFMLGTSPF